MCTRELIPNKGKRGPRPLLAASKFDYPATKIGAAGKTTVWYDPSLGDAGKTLAQQLLGAAPAKYADMEAAFAIAGSAVDVIVAPLSGSNDGSGGAYHYGCDFVSGGVLYLDATFSSTSADPLQLLIGLYIAELSESFMGAQNLGWGCGYSNGEGLSRFLAELETAPDTLDGFATGPAWVQQGFPNWVDQTEQTDRDPISTGCAVVYLYWMRSLGFTTQQIVGAGGATLAANYEALTGKTTAYADLTAALRGLAVTSDNPFAGAATPVAARRVSIRVGAVEVSLDQADPRYVADVVRELAALEPTTPKRNGAPRPPRLDPPRAT